MVTSLRTDMSRNGRDGAAIPFTSDWHSSASFADIPANAGVSDAAAMLEGWTATRKKALRGAQPEAAVGEWNTVQAALLEILARSRRAVARIVVPGGQTGWDGVRSDDGWKGTGFLVAPNLLLTNHHVLNSEAVAAVATAEFNYEIPSDKLATPQTGEPAVVRFELTPTRLFITSPLTGGGLDYSFVWITEKASEAFGTIPMQRGSFMISPFEPVFIIHHPQGRLKEISLDDTEVLGVNSVNILYAADTDYGSSGGCVLNRNGSLAALHHARQSGEQLKAQYPDGATQLSDSRPVAVANEGVKISAIAIDLETRMRGGEKDAESAAEVLEKIDGIFGAIGRQSAATADSDRVREIYCNSDQDADIGFWNMQWLLPGAGAPVSAEDAVTAMIDLNQDAWFLTDVPPAVVARIVQGMRDRFREDVKCEFGESDAQLRQLATAVIWRPNTISCTRLSWPEAVVAAFARPVPTLEDRGALFPTPPGFFRIAPADAAGSGTEADWQVRIVPVSLRSIRSDDLRRRLVSKLIVRAIELVIDAEGAPQKLEGCDWIVGGDVDPPLVHEDLEPLRLRGYRAIAATDKRRGSAVNYLRTQSSGIRNVFVTGDLKLVDNQGDFFEVIDDRTVDKYIYKLADNRPAVLRLARGFGHGTTSIQELDALLDATLPPAGVPRPDLQRQDRGQDRAAPRAERAWSDGLVWRGLDKPGLLTANRAALARLLAEVAARQGAEYPDLLPLTELDLWLLTFAEAGLGANGVDPGFRHSAGEVGLYPLPDNIGFWIGAGAPAWNQPMPIETNVEAYALYLGQIRNKSVATVGGRKLYRDLFREPGIAGAPARQARLLAGIVHGYFVSANYRGRSVPFDRILSGFAADQPIESILAGTDYVHAGSSILVNRQRNIDAATAAYHAA